MERQKPVRLAIVDPELCKPNKCKQECKKVCPPEKSGTRVFTIPSSKEVKHASISEELCIGCGMCASTDRGCPFGAIKIYNLPTSLTKDVVHRYGPNSFKLFTNYPSRKQTMLWGFWDQTAWVKLPPLKF